METSKPKQSQRPIKPSSNLLKITELNLGDKADLMKGSVFGSLSSVTNKRESSGTLVEALCKYYNASRKLFVLDNGACFDFCSKEVADILGMEDTGIDYEEYLQQCSHLNAKFPSYVLELRTKFVSGGKRETITISDLKDILSRMSVDDDESKQQFRTLMSYYLIEQVLLCGSNHNIPRKKMWRLVDDLDACEKVNWAKATMNHLHSSMSKVKMWMEGGASGQHLFSGSTPVLEAIIYNRISSMRPSTWSGDPHPPIQKYKAQRGRREWFEGKLSKLTSSTGIEECLHCTVSSGSPTAVEKTPEQSVDTFVVEELRDLSLSSIGDVVRISSDATTTSDVADPKIHAQSEENEEHILKQTEDVRHEGGGDVEPRLVETVNPALSSIKGMNVVGDSSPGGSDNIQGEANKSETVSEGQKGQGPALDPKKRKVDTGTDVVVVSSDESQSSSDDTTSQGREKTIDFTEPGESSSDHYDVGQTSVDVPKVVTSWYEKKAKREARLLDRIKRYRKNMRIQRKKTREHAKEVGVLKRELKEARDKHEAESLNMQVYMQGKLKQVNWECLNMQEKLKQVNQESLNMQENLKQANRELEAEREKCALLEEFSEQISGLVEGWVNCKDEVDMKES